MHSEYESDNESDNESQDEYDSSCYEPEEQSATKYNIVLCELYNKHIHGSSENKIVNYNYLTITRYKCINRIIYSDAKKVNDFYKRYLIYPNKRHIDFQNYENIISNKNYIKPEIAECIYLQSGECISILKTYLIRLIQRTWKNIYKKKTATIKLRFHPNSIKYREINGRWPSNCIYLPTIKGMMSYLKK
jgi:hypothetical protein